MMPLLQSGAMTATWVNKFGDAVHTAWVVEGEILRLLNVGIALPLWGCWSLQEKIHLHVFCAINKIVEIFVRFFCAVRTLTGRRLHRGNVFLSMCIICILYMERVDFGLQSNAYMASPSLLVFNRAGVENEADTGR